MGVLSFNYGSERAAKARFAAKLDKFARMLLGLTAVALVLAGLGLLYLGSALGWVAVGLAAVPVVLLVWYRRELHRLDVDHPDSDAIDELISSSVLGRLPRDPSPKDIALAVGQVQSGQFLAVRFGMGARFLQEIAADSHEHADEVWKNAINIRNALGVQVISGGILALAILQTLPQHEELLARLQLDMDDLMDGVKWFDHIYMMIETMKKPMHTGGIARDWSFGFTPLLNRFGRNLSLSLSAGRRMSADIPTHEQVVSQVIDTFSTGGRQGVALVGAAGVGKTTIVQALAERLLDASSKVPSNLKFRQVFLLDSAAIISAAPGRGEVEELVNQVLIEAYSAKNVILCLDNAHLFFEEGIGSVDLSNLLLPILEAGNVRMILTMDEQRLLEIGQRNPGLVNALNRINVQPADQAETMAAMEDAVIVLESQHKVYYMYQALKEAYRLSQRYIYDLAMPGQAIKLLEMAASHADDKFVTAESVEKAIEQTTGVKVGVASVGDEKEKLLNLEDLIHQRMINQVRAVEVVSDALRRARTGVRNQDRPIGTFLFLGPTGVGKTELAKALAEVYFNGEDNIVRVDLNQFVSIDDVANLTADGADNPASLTAQVMKHPFSVVLLDEIEKAHPNVLTALLQVLDEGVLRDAKNREVSFKDCIVIATSNAGADRIREYIDRGYDITQFEDQFVNELIDSHQFKPEFLNRFDEIVLFRPLGKEELTQVADLIIAGVNKTLASQKVKVEVDPEAKALLVEAGYDPRLGARPMRRVVQRVVENQVAKMMLAGEAASGSVIVVTKENVERNLSKTNS
ncbi:MAG: ATP-dependent Clp protease ATP-binding subunit [Candidatus Nomurabacteria bacterium]|jgi:ATP-dependent Clp protease ATP-binding subunit ClpC|nr:ATP-dependent Clp protease ATP-binding subunit [Candidatus Nomurabacteria bacterium]